MFKKHPAFSFFLKGRQEENTASADIQRSLSPGRDPGGGGVGEGDF
jgi:hypothetical protein